MSNSMDQIFKDTLSNHTSPVNENVWNAIENDLPTPKTDSISSSTQSSLFSTILSTTALTVAVGSLAFLVVTNAPEVSNKPIITENTYSENTHIENSTLTTLNTAKEEGQFVQEAPTKIQNGNAIPTVSPKKETSTTVLQSSSTTGLENTIESKPEITPLAQNTPQGLNDVQDTNKSLADQETEEVFKTGEFVTFTINFNNTSGKDVKSFKVWEEFPDWCDVSTLETISHNSNYEVVPVKKKRQNAIEWKIKGDFSGDLNSPDNTGFIEYRIMLTEDRKASELEKNQPGVN